jgi:hypothetical protein
MLLGVSRYNNLPNRTKWSEMDSPTVWILPVLVLYPQIFQVKGKRVLKPGPPVLSAPCHGESIVFCSSFCLFVLSLHPPALHPHRFCVALLLLWPLGGPEVMCRPCTTETSGFCLKATCPKKKKKKKLFLKFMQPKAKRENLWCTEDPHIKKKTHSPVEKSAEYLYR